MSVVMCVVSMRLKCNLIWLGGVMSFRFWVTSYISASCSLGASDRQPDRQTQCSELWCLLCEGRLITQKILFEDTAVNMRHEVLLRITTGKWYLQTNDYWKSLSLAVLTRGKIQLCNCLRSASFRSCVFRLVTWCYGRNVTQSKHIDHDVQ